MALTQTSRSLKLMCCFSEEVRSRIVRPPNLQFSAFCADGLNFPSDVDVDVGKSAILPCFPCFSYSARWGDLALFILPLSITVCSLPTTFLLAFPARTLICVPSSKICYLRLQTFEEQRYIV